MTGFLVAAPRQRVPHSGEARVGYYQRMRCRISLTASPLTAFPLAAPPLLRRRVRFAVVHGFIDQLLHLFVGLAGSFALLVAEQRLLVP